MPVVTSTPKTQHEPFTTVTGFVITPNAPPGTYFGKLNEAKFALSEEGFGPNIQDQPTESMDGNVDGIWIISTDTHKRVTAATTVRAVQLFADGTHRRATQEEIDREKVAELKRAESLRAMQFRLDGKTAPVDNSAQIKQTADAIDAMRATAAAISDLVTSPDGARKSKPKENNN